MCEDGGVQQGGVPTGFAHLPQVAGTMLHCIMEVYDQIYSGTFPVEKMRGAPLDMHQFTRVFGMTRVPRQGADSLVQASALARTGAGHGAAGRWVAYPRGGAKGLASRGAARQRRSHASSLCPPSGE